MPEITSTAPVYQYSQLTAAAQNTLVSEGILSGQLATFGGTFIPALEQRVAALIGRREALAVDSGSSALRLALRGLGIGPGDEVITPEAGWVSIGAAADSLGATVRVAPVTDALTPTWEQLRPLINSATRAVILVHLRGRPALGTEEISRQLAARRIALIEDCAQAWVVTNVEGQPAGSRGTMAVFSTHAFKLIATGEGGLIAGDDPESFALMRALAGDTRQATPHPVWRAKARTSELAAALALPQLDRLATLVADLRALQQQVQHALRTLPAGARPVPETSEPVGNGSHVGIRTAGAATAEHLANALFHAGYRSWWPGPGDLHTAHAWPVQPEGTVTDLRRYLDIQIPWLPTPEHAFWATLLATHIRAVLAGAR